MDILKYTDTISNYSLIFDDDGRVAYAYLLSPRGDIISDVWLYNIAKTPDEPEWKDRDRAPYLNSKEYVTEEKIKPVDTSDVIRVEWCHEKNKQLKRVKLFLYDELIAILFPNVKIGCCRFASKRGPLARPMSEFEGQKTLK